MRSKAYADQYRSTDFRKHQERYIVCRAEQDAPIKLL